MAKTNLEFLIDGVKKAADEQMTIITNGDPNTPGCIVVHNNVGYTVPIKDNKVLGCNCPHHTFRNAICKHMIKVSLEAGLDIEQLGSKDESNEKAI